jgi:SEC-C motif domain protein
MRSRYSAYVLGLGEYLGATSARPLRPGEVAELSAWGRSVGWLGLTILAREQGSAADVTGVVHFVARYVEASSLVSLEERSQFDRDAGRWRYLDGLTTTVRQKLGRNEPCPCGSGKKVKQCHA